MLALYRSGRQADSLAAFQRTRTYLSEELGLEPGPALRELQDKILNHDPTLSEPAPAAGARRERAAAPASSSARRGRGGPAAAPLPARSERLIGRDADVDAVVAMVRGDRARLTTITGPGGVGKTTLALEVAHRLASQEDTAVTFVDLTPVAAVAGVAETILRAVGATPEPGVETVETLCVALLGSGRVLVLDNFEHVLGAAGTVGALLRDVGDLRVVATSRAALGLRAEQRYALAPLALADADGLAEVSRAPACSLFIERARARAPGFSLTA